MIKFEMLLKPLVGARFVADKVTIVWWNPPVSDRCAWPE